MNVVGIARHGIGVTGALPLALAVARGLVLDLVRHADPDSLVLQVGVEAAERRWVGALAAEVRAAPRPPGVDFAIRVANGMSAVGTVLVARREEDLGDRLGSVLRLRVDVGGAGLVELDRRDGSSPTEVVPAIVGLSQAEEVVRAP